jgi:hypothetical protein
MTLLIYHVFLVLLDILLKPLHVNDLVTVYAQYRNRRKCETNKMKAYIDNELDYSQDPVNVSIALDLRDKRNQKEPKTKDYCGNWSNGNDSNRNSASR